MKTINKSFTKLGVIGSRSFSDKNRAFLEIDNLRKIYIGINTIVSGGAKGADTFGKEYAREKRLKYVEYQPDWTDMSEPCKVKTNAYGKPYNALAGFKRNAQIIADSDVIIAFWDGSSPGTQDSITRAESVGKQVFIIKI